MKILITGASGLLGARLAEMALARGHEVYSGYNSHQARSGKPVHLEITDQLSVAKLVSSVKPEVIIHTAALTDVDQCETERQLAYNVNAKGTENIARASRESSCFLIYVSTDAVFDGEKGGYSEGDSPHPLNWYGYTKLKGEEFTKSHANEWCIARTSVVYGWGREHRANFATWVLQNLTPEKELKVVNDQFASPTLNSNLAAMLLEVAETKITSLIHLAGLTRVSRYEFAQSLARTFSLDAKLVRALAIEELKAWKAPRAHDSSLSVALANTILRRERPVSLTKALEQFRQEPESRVFPETRV